MNDGEVSRVGCHHFPVIAHLFFWIHLVPQFFLFGLRNKLPEEGKHPDWSCPIGSLDPPPGSSVLPRTPLILPYFAIRSCVWLLNIHLHRVPGPGLPHPDHWEPISLRLVPDGFQLSGPRTTNRQNPTSYYFIIVFFYKNRLRHRSKDQWPRTSPNVPFREEFPRRFE